MVYTTCVRVYNCTYIIVPPTSPAMCVSLHICALICADVCLGRRWYQFGIHHMFLLLVSLLVFLFVFTFVHDGDDRVGLCQDGMYLLSMLPINCCPLMHLYSFPFKQHQLFFIWKVFPDCEIDPLEFINFRLRHLLPEVHSHSRWGVSLLDWDQLALCNTNWLG